MNGYDTDRPVSFHRGIDLATRSLNDPKRVKGPDGTGSDPVFAVHDGIITAVECDKPQDCTLYLRIPKKAIGADPDLTAEDMCKSVSCITAVYQHIQKITNYDYGTGTKYVNKGDMIAYSGESVVSGQNFKHLHFELRFHEIRSANPNTSYGPSGGNLKTGFAKDAMDPLAHLPGVKATDPVLDVVEVKKFSPGSPPFGNYNYSTAGDDLHTEILPLGVVVKIQAKPEYRMTAVKVQVVLFKVVEGEKRLDFIFKDGGAMIKAAKASSAVIPGQKCGQEFCYQDHWEIQGGEGSVLSGIYDPHAINRYLTPFAQKKEPQDMDGPWEIEDQFLPYFKDGLNSVDPQDTFTERTAESVGVTAGHRVFDHDFLLAKPAANEQIATDKLSHNGNNQWWSMELGFRVWNQPSLGVAECAEVIVETANTRVNVLRNIGTINCADYAPPPLPKQVENDNGGH